MELSLLMKQEKDINMKAKLIKKRTGIYKLESNGDVIASSDIDMNNDLQLTKLSLKNCQEIENGYDLDELVKERFGEAFWHDGDKYFKEGFQKALELMGDKKFSEEDVMLGWDAGVMSKSIVFSMEQLEPHRESYQRNLKPASLQQTEWDVEVEMEQITLPFGANQFITESKPKLDADGCLILKKL